MRNEERKLIMKQKEYHFDIEMIIDHNITIIGNEKVNVATHRVLRGYNLVNLIDLIKLNIVPDDDNTKITFNIRGVNY